MTDWTFLGALFFIVMFQPTVPLYLSPDQTMCLIPSWAPFLQILKKNGESPLCEAVGSTASSSSGLWYE